MTSFSYNRNLKKAAVICLSFAGSAVHAQQNIKIIPTIHKLHVVNAKYNYDSLRGIVADLEPTLIAVEIRNEDLNSDSNYLKRNYPYEMWMIKYWFPNVTIVGFDWLGPGLEGRKIPENYWKEQSDIKKWERLLAEDTSYNSKIEECDSFTHLRMNLLQSLSFSQLLKSHDSSLTVAYYECLTDKLTGSVHNRIVDFYRLRNERMADNIKAIIGAHPSSRLIILTGDDHYPFIIRQLHFNQ